MNFRRGRAKSRLALALALLLFAGACSDDGGSDGDDAAEPVGGRQLDDPALLDG